MRTEHFVPELNQDVTDWSRNIEAPIISHVPSRAIGNNEAMPKVLLELRATLTTPYIREPLTYLRPKCHSKCHALRVSKFSTHGFHSARL
jgi:hypothetical protein